VTLPDFVTKLISAKAPRGGEPSGSIAVGDIRLISRPDHGVSRHVLVCDINSSTATCEVLLMHSERDFATEFDVILDVEETKLTYTLVAQTDIRGRVWTIDLGRRISRVQRDMSRFAFDLPTSVSAGGLRGVRLAGPLDVRWKFKLQEGRVLSELTQSCLAAELFDTPLYDVTAETISVIEQLNSEERAAARTRLVELHLKRRLIVTRKSADRISPELLEALKSSDLQDDFGQEFVSQRLRDIMLEALTGDHARDQDQEVIHLTRKELVSA